MRCLMIVCCFIFVKKWRYAADLGKIFKISLAKTIF